MRKARKEELRELINRLVNEAMINPPQFSLHQLIEEARISQQASMTPEAYEKAQEAREDSKQVDSKGSQD